MELSSRATSEGLDNAIHSHVRPQLSVGSGQRSTLEAETWRGKVLRNCVVPPVNNMPTEVRHDLIRTPAAQQTEPVVQERRLECSELSEQHQAPPARQPRKKEQQIPGHVDGRMSAAERQPSPQQGKHYATLVAALREALRTKSEHGVDSNCCLLMRASNTSSQDKCALYDASHQIVNSHLGRSQPGTAASQQIQQCAADPKKQSRSAETSPSDAEHSKDCRPELTVNQQANHASRSIIASAIHSELMNPQQANAQLNAVATNCSSAQSPLDQAVHVKLSQQTVRQPSESLPMWWRHVHQNVPLVFLAQVPHEARIARLRVNLMRQDILALLDTSATHSFVSPRLVDEIQLQTKPPQECTYSTVASGEQLDVPATIPKVSFKVGNCCTSGRFFVAPVPYPLILGLDWLRGLRAVWGFGHDRISVLCGSGRFNLSVAEVTASDSQEGLGQAKVDTVRAEGKAAHADLVASLYQLGPRASALPTPEEASGSPRIRKSLQSLLGSRPCSPNQHKVEKWLATAQQQGVHPKVVQLVVKYRGLFLNELPDGLRLPRAFHMTIATIPNATVPKGSSPRFTQPELSAIRSVLEEYLHNK
ncbi:hypothetical protein Esti_003078 [Eimeria stiedai]